MLGSGRLSGFRRKIRARLPRGSRRPLSFLDRESYNEQVCGFAVLRTLAFSLPRQCGV
jgi:hypothetical protein